MKGFLILLLAFFLLCPQIVLSDSHTVTIKAPAVKKTEKGLEGVISYITVSATPGSGHVFMDTWPLTQIDMQGSSRLAVNVAREVTGIDTDAYDFFITFRSESPVVGGPSAGGAMTVAIIAALKGWELKEEVMMTGMINPDSSIGPIGGVLEKASVARENGVSLFLVPEGQRVITVQKPETKNIGPLTIVTQRPEKIDVVEYAQKNWGLEVREVYDITEAVFYFTGKSLPSPQRKFSSPDTYPLAPYARSEYEKAFSLLAQTEKNLDSYKGKYRGDFARILADGDSKLVSAKANLDSMKFFSALYDVFDAEINTEFAGNLLSFVTKEDPGIVAGFIEGVKKNLEEKKKESTKNFWGVTHLECIATSQVQMEEAQNFINQAEQLFGDGDYVGAIYNISLARQRLQSAFFWDELAEKYKGKEEISSGKIQGIADTMIRNAELSSVYAAELLGQNDAVNKSGELLAKSKREFEKGEYAASLFDAMQARVFANTSVEILVSGEDVLRQRLDVASSDAQTAIAISRERGIEPILASSYFELAQAMKDKDVVLSMAYFRYAKEVGHIFKYIEHQPEIQTVHTPENTAQPGETMPQAKMERYILGVLLFLVGVGAGFVVGRIRYK